MRKPLLLFGLACMLDVAGCARNAERIVPTLDAGASADGAGALPDVDASATADTASGTPPGADVGRTPDSASDVMSACDEGCPEFCQTPLVCAADGSQWCNECDMRCAGTGPAVDTSFCSGCAPPPEWTPIESRNLPIPEDCTSQVAFAITVDSSEFLDELFQCEAGLLSERVDVDFTRELLFLWIGFDNPNTRIAGVYDDGANLWVYAVEEAYCLGMPPEPLHHRLVAFGQMEARVSVLAQSCQYGTCGDPPRP